MKWRKFELRIAGGTYFKMKKYKDPFSFKSTEMAKKFDDAMSNKDVDLLYTLIEQSLKLIPTEGVASRARLYYSIGTIYGDIAHLTRNENIDLVKKQLYYFRKSIELVEAVELTKNEHKPYINPFKANLYTNWRFSKFGISASLTDPL